MIPLVEETERRRAAGKPNLFNSHMFDGSALPLKENLDIAVKLLERFRRSDLVLEIEAGVVGGEEDGIKASAAAKLYTTPEDTLEVARRLSVVQGARYLLAATFGNVHGVYKPGHVKLKPSILKDCQDAVVAGFGEAARFYLVFHGGSGSELHDIHEALDHGVVKMNVDTDMQYAFTRAIADHCFRNYDGVLKVDGEVGQQEGLRSTLLPGARRDGHGGAGQAGSDGAEGCRNDDGEVTVRKAHMRDGDLDFTIARLGECRVPLADVRRSLHPRRRARPLSHEARRT